MQKYGSLVIEEKELVLLKRLIHLRAGYREDVLRKSLKRLARELDSVQVLEEETMPKDVVRFNTIISIVAENGWNRNFRLVLPNEGDIKNDRVSVLTPMGAAVIGYAQGDSLEWDFPAGKQKLTIERVVQENRLMNINMVL